MCNQLVIQTKKSDKII